MVAQDGDHDVPPPRAELPHGPRQVRRGLDLDAALTDPLAGAVKQAAAAPTPRAHRENPQRLRPLFARCGGGGGGGGAPRPALSPRSPAPPPRAPPPRAPA